jgi:hypothetical protein
VGCTRFARCARSPASETTSHVPSAFLMAKRLDMLIGDHMLQRHPALANTCSR